MRNARRLDTNRLERFLIPGLTNRPVRIQWHRGYQELHKNGADLPAVIAKYDALLQAEPTNSAFLYLRGRMETNRENARDYFEKSLAADPKNSFASYALAYDRAAAADWAGARPLIARAVEENPRDVNFADLFYLCRLATGEAPQIEKESRDKLARAPFNLTAVEHLLDVLAIQDRPADATNVCNEFIIRCRKEYGARGLDLIRSVQYHTYHALGDFTQVKTLAARDTTLLGRGYLMWALIELGELDQAEKTMAATKELGDSEILIAFALAVAYRLQGNETRRGALGGPRNRAARQGQVRFVHDDGVVKSRMPPTRAEAVRASPFRRNPKQSLSPCWRRNIRKQEPDLVDLAAMGWNVGRDFAYFLVRRVTAPAP